MESIHFLFIQLFKNADVPTHISQCNTVENKMFEFFGASAKSTGLLEHIHTHTVQYKDEVFSLPSEIFYSFIPRGICLVNSSNLKG